MIGKNKPNSNFSHGARWKAERADAVPIALLKSEQLVLLLSEHENNDARRSHAMLEHAAPGAFASAITQQEEIG